MRKFILAAALAIVAQVAPAATLPWSDLIVFGDSLSDPGNSPFGTFTNGQPWAGQIDPRPFLSGGTNYAFGGARAVPNDGFGTGLDIIPDFPAQRAIFRTRGPGIGPDPLVVAWFGGNDLLNDPGDGSSIGSAVRAIGAGMAALAGTGLERFILPNLPDLASIPRFAAAPDAVRAGATAATLAFNAGLEGIAGAARAGGLDVKVFDTAGLFATVMADPSAFGFDPSRVTETCFSGSGCEGLLFWDEIHPTYAVHTLIADGIVALAQPAPVPLPATVWLLFGGVGGLLTVGRRRRMAA